MLAQKSLFPLNLFGFITSTTKTVSYLWWTRTTEKEWKKQKKNFSKYLKGREWKGRNYWFLSENQFQKISWVSKKLSKIFLFPRFLNVSGTSSIFATSLVMALRRVFIGLLMSEKVSVYVLTNEAFFSIFPFFFQLKINYFKKIKKKNLSLISFFWFVQVNWSQLISFFEIIIRKKKNGT